MNQTHMNQTGQYGAWVLLALSACVSPYSRAGSFAQHQCWHKLPRLPTTF
jgi:hypothetical protein